MPPYPLTRAKSGFGLIAYQKNGLDTDISSGSDFDSWMVKITTATIAPNLNGSLQ
jgi:hypothetical protein